MSHLGSASASYRDTLANSAQVVKYVQTVLKAVVSVALWGSERNEQVVMACALLYYTTVTS